MHICTLLQCYCSTTTVLLQYYYLQCYYSTTTVLLQYYCSTTTVLLQYYCSTTTVLLQYYYNIIIIIITHACRPSEAIVVDSDSESVAPTAVDAASPAGSVVFEPATPVFFHSPWIDHPAPSSSAFVPPGWGVSVSPPDPVPVLPPVPPSLLAPPNFWAPDFCHRTLTGCIGLPAPGYPLSEVRAPPAPPEPVPCSPVVPPDGSPLLPGSVQPAPLPLLEVWQDGRWKQAWPEPEL